MSEFSKMLYYPHMLHLRSELKNFLLSTYRVKRLVRRYDAPDILERIDPWGTCIEDYILIYYSRQKLGKMFIFPGKTHGELKKLRKSIVKMDKRLVPLFFIRKKLYINEFMSSVDFRPIKKNLKENLYEMSVGFKTRIKNLFSLDYYWRSVCFQWFNDLTTKHYIELYNMQLRLNKSKKARNIRRKKYGKNSPRRVGVTLLEGCQTLGCQVTSSKNFGHPYHLVNPSILPFAFSLTLYCSIQSVLGTLMFEEFFNLFSAISHAYFIALNVAVILTWFYEIFSEEQRGSHTLEVQKGFRYAILLFISSELMLFVSFFWAFFHFSLSPSAYTGLFFIPEGLMPFYWWRIPMLNTLLLLTSGLALTVTHILVVEFDKLYRVQLWLQLIGYFVSTSQANHRTVYGIEEWSTDSKFNLNRSLTSNTLLINGTSGLLSGCRYAFDDMNITVGTFINDMKNLGTESLSYPTFWMSDTVLKGLIFMLFQAFEYVSSMFSISDSVYGAIFFVLTGLHGIHVILGVIFLFAYLVVTLGQGILRDFYWSSVKLPSIVVTAVSPLTAFRFNFWTHRVAFDGSAWYWHFVDVVWFLVFVLIYWWSLTSI